jgi:hypothetical protein
MERTLNVLVIDDSDDDRENYRRGLNDAVALPLMRIWFNFGAKFPREVASSSHEAIRRPRDHTLPVLVS